MRQLTIFDEESFENDDTIYQEQPLGYTKQELVSIQIYQR